MSGAAPTRAPVRPPQDPNDADGWVRFWLDGALRCPTFHWDADQRELAELALIEAEAKATTRAPVSG